MTIWEWLTIAAIYAGATLMRLLYREYRLRTHGPSGKEFANAAVTLTLFMHHHNRTHRDHQMNSVTIYADGKIEGQ